MPALFRYPGFVGRIRGLVRCASLVAALGLTGGCRFILGPDDARPPDGSPDATFDGLAIDDALDGAEAAPAVDAPDVPTLVAPTRLDCDLLLQDCANHRGCYPDESFLGNTICEAKGAGGPLSPCMAQADCDGRLACITPAGGSPAARVCVELCRAGAETSGCQPGLVCASFPAYPGVGYCRY